MVHHLTYDGEEASNTFSFLFLLSFHSGLCLSISVPQSIVLSVKFEFNWCFYTHHHHITSCSLACRSVNQITMFTGWCKLGMPLSSSSFSFLTVRFKLYAF